MPIDFDNPQSRGARALTIVEGDNGVAWVFWHGDTQTVQVDHKWTHTEAHRVKVTIDGPARSVVATTVEQAMRVAAEYFAEPDKRRDERPRLTEGT